MQTVIPPSIDNPNNLIGMKNFKVKEGEREKLKNDAHAHRMNTSEYLRWLIDKQRKEDENVFDERRSN